VDVVPKWPLPPERQPPLPAMIPVVPTPGRSGTLAETGIATEQRAPLMNAKPGLRKCGARVPDAAAPALPCGEPCSVCAPAALARVLKALRSIPGIADVVRTQWLRMREAHDLTCQITYQLSCTGEHIVTLTWWREVGDDERQHHLSAYGSTSLEALTEALSKAEAWAHGEVAP
jgi:hypothetical protein